MYRTEAEVVRDLCSHVTDMWGHEARSAVEVRCHDQACMDILVSTQEDVLVGDLIAIETKLSDWNRVLAQAFLHKYCADYVFAALPASKINTERLTEAARFNIGVIAVDNSSTHIAQPASRMNPAWHIRSKLIDSISS